MLLRDEIEMLKETLRESTANNRHGESNAEERRRAMYRLAEIRKDLMKILKNGWFSENPPELH